MPKLYTQLPHKKVLKKLSRESFSELQVYEHRKSKTFFLIIKKQKESIERRKIMMELPGTHKTPSNPHPADRKIHGIKNNNVMSLLTPAIARRLERTKDMAILREPTTPSQVHTINQKTKPTQLHIERRK